MRLRLQVLSIVLALIGSASQTASAATKMVGVVPSDGVAMFVKRFSVEAGTTILGVEFSNNDARTVFPAVLLVRGVSTALQEGEIVARVADVRETAVAPGLVRVVWPRPIEVTQAEEYFVAVRIPSGPGKTGPGNGPALGADLVIDPNGSFLASEVAGLLTPLGIDLAITLNVVGIAKGAQPESRVREHQYAGTFLGGGVPNPTTTGVRIAFGVERTAHVRLSIYDISGRELRRLVGDLIAAGVYSREWDGRDSQGRKLANGVYIVKLDAGEGVITQKLVLAK